MRKINSSNSYYGLLRLWINTYEIPNTILVDKRPQIVSTIFVPLCAFMDVGFVTATEYHLNLNGQLERCNKTVVTRLWHYIESQ